MSVLKAENLSVQFGNNRIIEKLSFAIDKGDYLCVIGENGSGKTTLMKTILGLLKPSEGTIEFGDGVKPNQIGYLPQSMNLQEDFPATVEEVVQSGCLNRLKNKFFYDKEMKQACKEMMEKLDLLPLANASYRTLSGGQRQRVLLARALLASSEILLLDEPVTGLDPERASEMYQLIHRLNQDGMTIVMISHDVKEIYQYATHILDFGNKVTFQKTKDYLKEKGIV
ncbi:MAG: metal ABC transporter ATP-binding protein [Solobacterium sp.]|nr:metal ABC transporter ATP-binding protein [Solobacterium sp.]